MMRTHSAKSGVVDSCDIRLLRPSCGFEGLSLAGVHAERRDLAVTPGHEVRGGSWTPLTSPGEYPTATLKRGSFDRCHVHGSRGAIGSFPSRRPFCNGWPERMAWSIQKLNRAGGTPCA